MSVFPRSYVIGEGDRQIYLTPACERIETDHGPDYVPVAGPGLVVRESEISVVRIVDKVTNGCHRWWDRPPEGRSPSEYHDAKQLLALAGYNAAATGSDRFETVGRARAEASSRSDAAYDKGNLKEAVRWLGIRRALDIIVLGDAITLCMAEHQNNLDFSEDDCRESVGN